jgi:hypothetical protein
MDWFLLTVAALALIGLAAAMILFEQARNRTSPPFPATEGGRMSYWMTYLFLLVLGVTFLIKAVVG